MRKEVLVTVQGQPTLQSVRGGNREHLPARDLHVSARQQEILGGLTMKHSEWRETLKPIIHAVVTGRTTATVKELRRDLRDAWDFNNLGPRDSWAYRVWCEESRKALGLPNRIERKTGQQVVDFQEVEA
jgi:hypothetical protein